MPEVFQFRVTDKTKGVHTIETRWSTRERIARIGGMIQEDTRREIDERFLGPDGRAVIDPAGMEGGILRQIYEAAPKQCRIAGTPEIEALRKLQELKLVGASTVGMNLAYCILTDLGKTAVEQLIATGGAESE